MNNSATPFERLVDDLQAASQARDTSAVLAKSLEAQRQGLLTARDVAVVEALANRGQAIPEAFQKAMSAVDAVQAHREAEHGAGDERIAAAALDGAGKRRPSRAKPMTPAGLNKRIAEAQDASRLRPGDLARAEAAMNLDKPVPRDVLARILGGA
jgi:hypothetical protein